MNPIESLCEIGIESFKTQMVAEQPSLYDDLVVITRQNKNMDAGWETVILDSTESHRLPEFFQYNIFNASNDGQIRTFRHLSIVQKLQDVGYSEKPLDKSHFTGYEDASLIKEMNSFSIPERLNLMELRAKYESQLF
ncbi:MAG: hypothetical protein GY861_26580 [bacterium]|nr:hypothetical protein [bacterium]